MINRLPSKPHGEPDHLKQEKLLREQGMALPESMTAKPQPAARDKGADGKPSRGKR